MNAHISNPELLREGPPDLRDGIPAGLWNGADARSRHWFLAESGPQLPTDAHRREADIANRQESLRRILARPARDENAPAAQLRRLQTLLIEAAAAAGTLANLPAADGPPSDAEASQAQEPHP